jgi:L-aminopeptidase/D-esterase-like protein
MQKQFWILILMTAALSLATASVAGVRARDAGVPFEGRPGPLNAITDVAGVEVGQVTLIEGEGALHVGSGPTRTGLTAIFPKGRGYMGFVSAGTFVANGMGEMTGRALIDEIGEFTGPVVLTGTGSVGIAHDTVQAWYARKTGGDPEGTFIFALPVVAETFDGRLNDTFGQHLTPEHVAKALDTAQGGPVEEGGVGGGTGMVAYGFKGGIGTASQQVAMAGHIYTLGVLVQANYGARDQLTIAGVPVGRQLAAPAGAIPPASAPAKKEGSIIVVIATDAPLLPAQLRRLALRATHGVARVGGLSGTTSGDMFVAFSTARPQKVDEVVLQTQYIDSFALNPLLAAAAFGTEEAIVNALFAGRTMRGINGTVVEGLPVDAVRSLLRAAGRLQKPKA